MRNQHSNGGALEKGSGLWEQLWAYLVRVAGKLLTGNGQLTVKTPDNHLYPQVWDDWVAVGLGL